MPAGLKIASIILQYGHWRKTAECVKSILACAPPPHWIIVVDNASPDDSARRIEEFLHSRANACGTRLHAQTGSAPPGDPDSRFFLIRLETNRGYAAGNNAGLALALALGAEAMLVLNNDTTLAPQAPAELWKRLNTCERPGLCGGLIVHDRPNYPVQCLGGGHTNYWLGLSSFAGQGLSLEEARQVDAASLEKKLDFICGACVMASREFVEKIGLLDEGFFLYCEEQDWALRAAGQFDLAWTPHAVIYHHEGATTGWSRFEFNWRSTVRLARSRLRLTWKHYPLYLPGVILCMCYSAVRQGARRLGAAISKSTARDDKRQQ